MTQPSNPVNPTPEPPAPAIGAAPVTAPAAAPAPPPTAGPAPAPAPTPAAPPTRARPTAPARGGERTFRPNGLVVSALVVFGAAFLYFITGSGVSAEELGERAVRPVVLTIALVLALSYAAFRLFARSNRAGNVTLASLTALAGLAVFALRERVSETRATGRAPIEAAGDGAGRDGPGNLDQGSAADLGPDQHAAISDTISGASDIVAPEPGASDASADAEAAMRRAAADLDLARAPLAEKYQAASDEFLAAGGVAWGTLAATEGIDGRLGTLDRCERAHDELVAALAAAPQRLEEALVTLGIGPEARARFIRAYREDGGLSVAFGVHRHESQAIRETRAMLTLLKERWGAWRVAEGSDLPAFDRPEDTEEFAARWDAFLQSNESAEALRQQLPTR